MPTHSSTPWLALTALAGALLNETAARATASEPMTVIVGVVRTAVTRTPIANSIVYTNHFTLDTALTDSAGRFTIRVSRFSSLIGARKDGFLEFQFPVLNVNTDTLFADIELRSDPPAQISLVPRIGFLPFLCIVVTGDQLTVTNGCADRNPPAGFAQQIIKHNPWSLYFGPAGDRGGVMLRTRISADHQGSSEMLFVGR